VDLDVGEHEIVGAGSAYQDIAAMTGVDESLPACR
jgi:hypothetical protein